MPTTETSLHPDQLHPIPVVSARLGVSRSSLYRLISEGAIRTVHIGKRHLIPETALTEFLSSLQAEASKNQAHAAAADGGRK